MLGFLLFTRSVSPCTQPVFFALFFGLYVCVCVSLSLYVCVSFFFSVFVSLSFRVCVCVCVCVCSFSLCLSHSLRSCMVAWFQYSGWLVFVCVCVCVCCRRDVFTQASFLLPCAARF